jgi:hypothetical protein
MYCESQLPCNKCGVSFFFPGKNLTLLLLFHWETKSRRVLRGIEMSMRLVSDPCFTLYLCNVSFHFMLRNFENVLKYDSRDSSVGIENRLLFGRRRDPGRVKKICFSPRARTGSGAHPAPHTKKYRGSFPRLKQPGREADHSHLTPRLIIVEFHTSSQRNA